ncbi:hypothetical protein WL90_31190 [Burkholderia cenocepacia]|nr:pyrroloquinoline quinone precursor peptide PqqA [Burkholderia cenocepacia]AOK38726.1 hypothetical protein WL90_31190 [Burkholderia cenocepacia]
MDDVAWGGIWRSSTLLFTSGGKAIDEGGYIAERLILYLVVKIANINMLRKYLMWIKPAYIDLRLGFEITMYVANR